MHAPQHLAVAHAIGACCLELPVRHRIHRAVNDVGGEGAIDDAERDAGQRQIFRGGQEPVGGRTGRPLRGACGHGVGRADILRHNPFHCLLEGEREEQEEQHVRHAAHDVGVDRANEAQRREARAPQRSAAEPAAKRDQRPENGCENGEAETRIPGEMLAIGQIAQPEGKIVTQHSAPAAPFRSRSTGRRKMSRPPFHDIIRRCSASRTTR